MGFEPDFSVAAPATGPVVGAPSWMRGEKAEPLVLTADQVAELLQVSRWWVYDHAEELGRVKLGGANRYLLDRVVAYLDGQLASPDPSGGGVASGGRRQRSAREPARRVRLLDPATGLRPDREGS